MDYHYRRWPWLLGMFGLIFGCQPRGTDRPHTDLGPDAAALRVAFNADTGKVRVVMLVAPT